MRCFEIKLVVYRFKDHSRHHHDLHNTHCAKRLLYLFPVCHISGDKHGHATTGDQTSKKYLKYWVIAKRAWITNEQSNQLIIVIIPIRILVKKILTSDRMINEQCTPNRELTHWESFERKEKLCNSHKKWWNWFFEKILIPQTFCLLKCGVDCVTEKKYQIITLTSDGVVESMKAYLIHQYL